MLYFLATNLPSYLSFLKDLIFQMKPIRGTGCLEPLKGKSNLISY